MFAVEHALNVCGPDHVAIGSDREHRTIPDTPAEKQKLIDELSRLRPVTAATAWTAAVWCGFIGNAVFVVLFVGSALLFRKASR